jgi:RHS repeat-associated protein
MTAIVGARKLISVDAGVVHAFMQARYQNSSRGQFISEDPVFLGDPKQQVLTDPQSLNSCSYANDNPITKSDPSGRCLEDGCIIEGAAAFGFAGGIAAQAFHDYTTGDFSRRSIGQNISTYALAGTEGAAVAAGTALVGVETATLGLAARIGATGLTGGVLTAGNDLGSNYILGQPTDRGTVTADAVVNGLSAGFLTMLPGTPGALPQSLSSALNFISKAHASRTAAEAAFGTGLQVFGTTGYQYMSSGSSWSNSTTPGTSGSSAGQSSSGNLHTACGTLCK